MRKLSNFLAGFLMEDAILSDDDIKNDMQEKIAEQIAEGIERYKEHLKTDTPRTAGWVMREKELITALERMESPAHKSNNCPACREHPIAPGRDTCIDCSH